MSEYIPTTEEVRDWWTGGDDGLLRQEFNRWLAQVKAEAWDEGRNAEPVHDGDHDIYCSEYECFCGVYVNPYRKENNNE